MPRDAVSRTANIGTVVTNGLMDLTLFLSARALTRIMCHVSSITDTFHVSLTVSYFIVEHCHYFIEYETFYVTIVSYIVEFNIVDLYLNPFIPKFPTCAVRESYVSRYNGGTSGAPILHNYIM